MVITIIFTSQWPSLHGKFQIRNSMAAYQHHEPWGRGVCLLLIGIPGTSIGQALGEVKRAENRVSKGPSFIHSSTCSLSQQTASDACHEQDTHCDQCRPGRCACHQTCGPGVEWSSQPKRTLKCEWQGNGWLHEAGEAGWHDSGHSLFYETVKETDLRSPFTPLWHWDVWPFSVWKDGWRNTLHGLSLKYRRARKWRMAWVKNHISSNSSGFLFQVRAKWDLKCMAR